MAGKVQSLSAHEVVHGASVVVIYTNNHLPAQVLSLEGETLVPFWIQVPMYDGTAIFERWALELDVRITAPW